MGWLRTELKSRSAVFNRNIKYVKTSVQFILSEKSDLNAARACRPQNIWFTSRDLQ